MYPIKTVKLFLVTREESSGCCQKTRGMTGANPPVGDIDAESCRVHQPSLLQAQAEPGGLHQLGTLGQLGQSKEAEGSLTVHAFIHHNVSDPWGLGSAYLATMLDNLLLKELCPGLPNATGHNMGTQGAQPLCVRDIQMPTVITVRYDLNEPFRVLCPQTIISLPFRQPAFWGILPQTYS